jgi:prepilin-type processing-associated H-X9-DG protein
LRWIELGAVLVVVMALAILCLPMIRNTMTPVRPMACADNLRQWAAIFTMYRTEYEEGLPPVQGFQPFGPAENAPGCANVHDDFAFCPDLASVFPEYSRNFLILACPDGPTLLPPAMIGPLVRRPWRLDPDGFGILQSTSFASCRYAGAISNGDAAYTYLGWRIDQPEDDDYVLTREQALRWHTPASGPVQIVALLANLQVTASRSYKDVQAARQESFALSAALPTLGPPYTSVGNRDTNEIQPSYGIFRFYYGFRFGEPRDPSIKPPVRPYFDTTPVMWDTVYRDGAGNAAFVHRNPEGVNVLYMDGHVEFVAYPGKFPASPAFVNTSWAP